MALLSGFTPLCLTKETVNWQEMVRQVFRIGTVAAYYSSIENRTDKHHCKSMQWVPVLPGTRVMVPDPGTRCEH